MNTYLCKMNLFKYLFFLLCILHLSCKKTNVSTGISIDYPAAYIINGGDNSISVLNLSTNTIDASIQLSDATFPHHIYLSPDKKTLAIGLPGSDLSGGHSSAGGHSHGTSQSGNGHKEMGEILVLDAVTLQERARTKTPSMAHNAVYTTNGKQIWSAKMVKQGQIIIYSNDELRELKHINTGNTPLEVTMSADGSTAFVANSGSNTVEAFDVTSYKSKAIISVGKTPVGAWAASNNKMYVDNEAGKSISEIDVASLKVTATIALNYTPAMAKYNKVYDELWVSNATNGAIHYYKKLNSVWTENGSIDTGADAHALAFSANEKTCYITNQGAATVSILDVINHTKIKDVSVGSKPNGIVLRN